MWSWAGGLEIARTNEQDMTVSSGVTRWTRDKGWLGLGASNSRQERYNMCIAQIKSEK